MCFLSRLFVRAALGGDAEAALATWTAPSAGMFCWLRLAPDTLDASGDSGRLVKDVLAAQAKVLVVPGAEFMPDASAPSAFVRASFSTASLDAMDEALRRLGEALRAAREANRNAK